ncbi:hypothetical protein [Rhizobium brockwellii]
MLPWRHTPNCEFCGREKFAAAPVNFFMTEAIPATPPLKLGDGILTGKDEGGSDWGAVDPRNQQVVRNLQKTGFERPVYRRSLKLEDRPMTLLQIAYLMIAVSYAVAVVAMFAGH